MWLARCNGDDNDDEDDDEDIYNNVHIYYSNNTLKSVKVMQFITKAEYCHIIFLRLFIS